jgi:chromosome segregation ATPase
MAVNPDINIIVKQLERMSYKIDEISKEVQLTNIEITKLHGLKHAISDFKTWKENVESAVNAEDLREMKSTISLVKKHSEEIGQLEKEIEELYEEKKKDKEEITKLNTFKTKSTTVVTIFVFLFTAALTIFGWFFSS